MLSLLEIEKQKQLFSTIADAITADWKPFMTNNVPVLTRKFSEVGGRESLDIWEFSCKKVSFVDSP